METITLKVAGANDMQAYAARPASPAAKGIIVLQEVFGITDYMQRMTQRFADQGYLAIAPEIFHRTAPPGFTIPYGDFAATEPHREHLTEADQLADITACFEWLKAQGIAENRIAVLGFCAGGTNSFLANASLPIACAVSFYGGDIAKNLLGRAQDLHGPQLVIWGGKDASITNEDRRAVADALAVAGKSYIEITFSDAGHAFTRDVGERYNPAATKEALALVDAFLANNIT